MTMSEMREEYERCEDCGGIPRDENTFEPCVCLENANDELQKEIATLRSQLDAVTKERGELRQRVQQAEKAARTTIDDCRRQGVSLGRSLANYACKMERHRAERMERVVEAARRWADACATGDDDLEEDALRDAVRALDATPTREDE